VLWEVTDKVRGRRLKRFTVPIDKQDTNESELKWIKVTEAIVEDNQEAATTEKTKLEEEQRKAVTTRLAQNTQFIPKHFVYVIIKSCHLANKEFGYKFKTLYRMAIRGDTSMKICVLGMWEMM
jgi:hypothetical protein